MMTELDQSIDELEQSGHPVTLAALGGVERVLGSEFHTSQVFGVVSSTLANEWDQIDDVDPVLSRLADGLSSNNDRLALRESIHALQALPSDTFRPFVMALETRTRNEAEHPLLQAEASAGLVRFALADDRWSSNACAALQAYQPGRDALADPMYCRLASVAHDFFGFTGAVHLLEEYAQLQTTGAQAKLERGLVEVSLALSCASTSEIEIRLIEAEKWLAAAVEADDERRDTRSYHLLIKSLLSVQTDEQSDLRQLVDDLRSVAFISDLWDQPAPGMEWLSAPSSSLSSWVPVVESLSNIANQLGKPSWLDASAILEHVYHLYSVNRSVRPGSPNLGLYFKPVIEAAFVCERGLAAHLQQWLEVTPETHFHRADAERLRANIAVYAEERGPPKKL